MLIPLRSLKMRLKKTCDSWRWIWPVLSVGLPLDVGSGVHLSPSCAQHPLKAPLEDAVCGGTALPASPSWVSQRPRPAPGLDTLPLRGASGSLAPGAGGRGRWAPHSPQGPLHPCTAPARLLAYCPVSLMSCS